MIEKNLMTNQSTNNGLNSDMRSTKCVREKEGPKDEKEKQENKMQISTKTKPKKNEIEIEMHRI